MFVLNYLFGYYYLSVVIVTLATTCQPPTPTLQFGSSYNEQVNGVPSHAQYYPENSVDYGSSNQVEDTQQPIPPNPVASGVLPETPINPIPVPPQADSAQHLNPPKDPFALLGGSTGHAMDRKCKEEKIQNLEEFLECTEVQPSENNQDHARFGTQKCDFEIGTVCRFYTSPNEPLKFELGRFNALQDSHGFATKFSELTQRPVGSVPNNTFMIVSVPIGTNAKSEAILQTDISCQKGNGKLGFEYWSTYDRLIVKVCTRNEYERSCTQNIEYYAATAQVEVDVIHPETKKFLIELIVYGFSSPAAFILDNLQYEAELCDDIQDNEIQINEHERGHSIGTTTSPNRIQGVTAMTQNTHLPQQNPTYANILVPQYPVSPVQQQHVQPRQNFYQAQNTQNFLQPSQIQQNQVPNYQQQVQPFQQQQPQAPPPHQNFGHSQQLQSYRQVPQEQSGGNLLWGSRRWRYPQYNQQPPDQNWVPPGLNRQRFIGNYPQYPRQPIHDINSPVTFGNTTQPIVLHQNVNPNSGNYAEFHQNVDSRAQYAQSQPGHNPNQYNQNWRNKVASQNGQYPRLLIQEIHPKIASQSQNENSSFFVQQNAEQTHVSQSPIHLPIQNPQQPVNQLPLLPNITQLGNQILQQLGFPVPKQDQTVDNPNLPDNGEDSALTDQNAHVADNFSDSNQNPITDQNLHADQNLHKNLPIEGQNLARSSQNSIQPAILLENQSQMVTQKVDASSPGSEEIDTEEQQHRESYQNVTIPATQPTMKYPYYDNNYRSPWHRNPWSMRNNQYPMPPRLPFCPQCYQRNQSTTHQQFYGRNPQYPYRLLYGLPNPGISRPLMKQEGSDLVPSVTFGRLAIKKMTPCDILSCGFDRGMCHYTQPRIKGEVNAGRWQISHTPIGNRHTGIRQNGSIDQISNHGGFAFVGTDKNQPKLKGRTVYILESPFFTLNEDVKLNFDLYRRAAAITLQVCLDNLMNCPYEAPQLNKDVYWKEGESVTMPKNTTKIYFVATQWKRFKWLAIDNITINKGLSCLRSTESQSKIIN